MSEQNWMEKAGATPRKLMLITVLAVVLIVVVVCQLPSSSASAQLVSSNPSTAQSQETQQRPNIVPKSQPNAVDTTTPSTNQLTNTQQKRVWPKLPMDSILSYDPLATPDWLSVARDPETSADKSEIQQRREDVLQRLREQGAQAIVFSGNNKHAAIGDQSIRIGETFEGFRITDITREGIVLTEFEPQ